MRKSKDQLRVAVLAGGGLGHVSGGVGTLMGYMLEAWGKRADGPDVTVFDTRGAGGRAAGAARFLAVLARLGGLCAAGGADLVHAHMTTRGSVVRKAVLCGVAGLLGVPFVVHMHGADFAAFHGRMHPAAQCGLGFVLRRASRVIVLGEGWRDFLVGAMRIDAGRVVIVLNGVPRPSERPARAEGPPRILFLGRIGDRKGVPELLAALATPVLGARAWRATIAGDGEVARMVGLRDGLGLTGRVDLPGWASREQAAALLAQADMLVLPSHHEALPVAVIEALSWRVPVITTPVGAVPEFLTDGVDALLVQPGDVAALAGAIGWLLDDAALAGRVAQAGFGVFGAQLEAEVAAGRLLGVYFDALKEGRPSFLKKRSKKLLLPVGGCSDQPPTGSRSFLVLFFKKGLLAFFASS